MRRGPSDVPGKEIERRGSPSRTKVRPLFGTAHREGHAGFACQEAGFAV